MTAATSLSSMAAASRGEDLLIYPLSEKAGPAAT
jgi:hypothetical protein